MYGMTSYEGSGFLKKSFFCSKMTSVDRIVLAGGALLSFYYDGVSFCEVFHVVCLVSERSAVDVPARVKRRVEEVTHVFHLSRNTLHQPTRV